MPDRPSVRVVVLDHDQLFLAGLRELLEADGIDVVGEGAPSPEAVELIRRLEPDAVSLNPAGGVDADLIASVAQAVPAGNVLAIADSAEPGTVIEAIGTGAAGYLHKAASGVELAAGVRAVAAGGSAWPRAVAAALAESARDDRAREDAIRTALSDREIDVLRLVAQGRDNAEIARELFISPDTVKNHISKILSKLGLENRIQAAVYAVRSKLV